MRLFLKRALFDGEKLHDRGVADVSDLLVPPRDAEVWDGDEFVPIPVLESGEVDVEALETTRGEAPVEPSEDDEPALPVRRRRKK